MKLTIQLFAGLSEFFKAGQLQLTIEEDSITAGQLKQFLIHSYPQIERVIQSSFIAINHAYAQEHETIIESDEIALIPPVSGGQAPEVEQENPLFEITYDPLDIAEISRKVIHPNNGATLSFVGTTRELTAGKKTLRLEYEAYIPMAYKAMVEIGRQIADQWPGTLTAISHRLGLVEVSEISVVIAVSSPHRSDCYEASRYAIERLKQIVPIWKKEIWEDGSQWKGHQQGPWNPLI